MTDRLRGWILVVAQLALLGFLVLAPSGTAWPLPRAVRALGRFGGLLGAVAVVVGGLRLGSSARVHPAPTTGATLRTDGPYRYVRHPIYTGVLAIGASLALTGRTLAHVGAFAARVAVLGIKAGFEERLLADRFSDYPAYAARTGRFLPRLGRRRGRR